MSDSPTQDVLVKLEGAVRDVSEWLDMKMRSGQYSIGLVVELAQHLIGRGHNVHTIDDEIDILEGDDRRASLTKVAAPFQRPPLLGLWHKHHHQPRFMSRNLLLELQKDGAIEDALAPYYGRCVDEAAGRIVHELVMKTFARRAAEQRLTGEFIVASSACHKRLTPSRRFQPSDAPAGHIGGWICEDLHEVDLGRDIGNQ